MQKEDIEKIIVAGTYAPSGENSQPWRFEVKENQIKIFNLPERDLSVYNHNQTGSLVAHGALLENITIASDYFSYKTTISIPEKDLDLISTVDLFKNENNKKQNNLYEKIFKRATNRKPFSKIGLAASEIEKLNYSENGIDANFVSDKNTIKSLANLASMNEKLLFENQNMHDFFFSHINWTKEEDAKKSVGFYIKTLELPPPAKIIFKLAKSWKRLNFLNNLGLSNLIRKANTATYESCGGIVVFSTPNMSKINLINTGRLIQKIWLRSTSLNLQAQPVSGILFVAHAVLNKKSNTLNNQQIEMVKNAYYEIKKAANLDTNKEPVFMLRVGNAPEPSTRASRLKPEIKWA